MLHCPVCKKEGLVVLEFDDIEIDYCLTCKGIWLDAGEMDLMIGNAEQAKQILESFESVSAKSINEKERPCPICDKKMEKIVIHTVEDQIVDRCRDGHGIWFDHGELHSILDNAKKDGEASAIVSFLKDILERDLQK
ncbi:zf-TFIIB domain-containing protein [bacterium]|nr:zf-TFIIB domain-containing protein [bacterium]